MNTTANKQTITKKEFTDAIIGLFQNEDFSRAVGAINSMHEEYKTRSHKIDSERFKNESERLDAKAREFQKLAENAQRELKQGIGRAASKFHGSSANAVVARQLQSNLQKTLNASNYHKQQYAKQAVSALSNANKSANMANNLGKFANGATFAMGAISMGGAWLNVLSGNGDLNDVGRASSSFLGGLVGAKVGAFIGTLAFGLFTGGTGWLIAGAILGGGAGAWYGSEWAEDLWDGLSNWLELKPNRSGKYRVYDPITLDLNGDGIHALAANGFAGALFDHDNDGIRTATGWVNKEDGLLVRDLNGNGIIDNGSELFGDNTALADGSKAAHGYVALAELDSNSDGKVDASDKAFNELKVWIDANSDGICQASELRTLMDLDIQSLDVAYKDVNQNLGNGNSIQQLGSYTKTDGSTAQMGDAWFAADKLYSRFTDKIDMTVEQAQTANDERYFQAA